MECHKCKKLGHFSRVCISSSWNHYVKDQLHNDDTDENIFFNGSVSKAAVCMEKDNGASKTLISKKIWLDLGKPALSKARGRMLSYDGHEMMQIGTLEALMEMNGLFF